MNKNGQIFTEIEPLKKQLIDSLVEGKCVSAAARLAGISRTTVYNWLRDPEFTRELRAQFAEEEEKRLTARNDCLKKAWGVINQAMGGVLSPEDKTALPLPSSSVL